MGAPDQRISYDSPHLLRDGKLLHSMLHASDFGAHAPYSRIIPQGGGADELALSPESECAPDIRTPVGHSPRQVTSCPPAFWRSGP